MDRKSIVFIAKQSPFDLPDARENLDMLLMLASFEVSVTILFMNAGVLQLKEAQHEKINMRAFSPVLKALPHYEIKNLYALQKDMRKFSISEKDSLLPVKLIEDSQVKALLEAADYIF